MSERLYEQINQRGRVMESDEVSRTLEDRWLFESSDQSNQQGYWLQRLSLARRSDEPRRDRGQAQAEYRRFAKRQLT